MLKINKSKIAGLITPVLFFAVPAAALAQGGILVPTTLTQTGNIINVVQFVIRFILIVAFVLAFVMLLVGGIRWIMAGGDEKSVEKARNTITAALIGLVVVLIAYAIIRIVETFFNVSIITGAVTIPTLTPGL